MRPSALAAAGALVLAPLLGLAACPSLGEIGVGSPMDATVDRGSPPPPVDAGTDARRDAVAPRDTGVDAPCTADVAKDPVNCGRCGHDCLGGTCTSGACDPVVVYSGTDTPSSIVVAGPTIFVTVDLSNPYLGYVFRCTTANCQATKTEIATGLVDPWFAAGLGKNLYWDNGGTQDGGATTPGSVVSCPVTGCPEAGPVVYTPEGGVDGGGNITGLAVDSTYLYWGGTAFGFSSKGSIFRCAMADCPGTLVALVEGTGFIPLEVAVDSSYVYWTDLGTDQVLRCKLPSCGGNPQIFANNQISASGLALYAGEVYWTQGIDDGGVLHCPASGCGAGPATIASGQSYPVGLAVDDSGVYWSNIDDGTVRHCPLAGCTKPTVIAYVNAPFFITLDAVSVYVTSSTLLGEVVRVAK